MGRVVAIPAPQPASVPSGYSAVSTHGHTEWVPGRRLNRAEDAVPVYLLADNGSLWSPATGYLGQIDGGTE